MKTFLILCINLLLTFNTCANISDSIQFNLSSSENKTKYKVGLLIMATGRYINFVSPLIESAQKYFCKNHDVTYFVFTDDTNFKHDKAIRIFQEKLSWPFATLMRYHTYLKNKNYFLNMDYLFACDADMLFVNSINDEILSERVVTLHPGYYGWKKHNQPLPYETNQLSTACINAQEHNYYFAGGFYGGTTIEMLKLFKTNANNVDLDAQKNCIAIWHDESHNNKYFSDNIPTKILTPDYCFPEDAVKPELRSSYELILNLTPKLIALARKATKEEIEDDTKVVNVLNRYKTQIEEQYKCLKTIFNNYIKNKGQTIGYFEDTVNHDTNLFNNIASQALEDLKPEFINLTTINHKKIDLMYLNSKPVDDLIHARLIIEKNLLSQNGMILINSNKSEYAISYLLNSGFEIVHKENQVILKKRD